MEKLEKEIYDENNGLWYTLADDGCYYPNLVLPEEDNTWVGKYGLMRKTYLIEYKNWYYMHLYLSSKLNQHLMDINKQAQAQVDQMVAHWAKLNGVDENLKDSNQMEWVGRMNNYQMMAEEVVLREIVCR